MEIKITKRYYFMPVVVKCRERGEFLQYRRKVTVQALQKTI
jgi:hypothetical protein